MRPGLLTTVQDLGRWGYQSLGVPVAGAMDSVSHRIANLLVGNDPSAATLEATMTGPELAFTDARRVAVTGARFDLSVDGHACASDHAFIVPGGSVLRFGERTAGARAYLAIAGGIDVPVVLGSRSTYLPAMMGGHRGRALTAGDALPLGPSSAAQTRSDRVPPMASADRQAATSVREWTVRLVAGPQHDRFHADALDTLQSGRYMVGPDSDRMGVRLTGPALRHNRWPEIISDATPAGTLQVPASGLPILLMADRQTTGGYPKIATVITADLPLVAQAVTGDMLTFTVCSQAEALAALIAQEQAVLAYEVA